MKKAILYIILFITCCTSLQAEKIMNRETKGPRGMYVFMDQLEQIYPFAKLKKVPTTIYNSLKDGNYSNTMYMVTVSEFLPTFTDLQALKNFAREGNHVFIFCYYMSREAREFFDVVDTLQATGLPDSLTLEKDGQSVLGSFQSRMFTGFESSFSMISGRNTTVLGRNAKGKANFLRIKYGSGAVFIHLMPDVLTNYFLLEKENYRYTQAVLSYAPKNIDEILWKLPRYARNGNQSYDGNDKSEFSFLSVIWNNPNLRWAFLLGLLVLFLLLLFGSKRKQRTVPIIAPVENTTFEFAQTMGDLYFNQHNNVDMADKKIKYWQEYVRNNYNLSTRDMNKEFWDTLSKKSGQPQEVIKGLEVAIVKARNRSHISDRDLVHLSNSIDQFYKD